MYINNSLFLSLDYKWIKLWLGFYKTGIHVVQGVSKRNYIQKINYYNYIPLLSDYFWKQWILPHLMWILTSRDAVIWIKEVKNNVVQLAICYSSNGWVHSFHAPTQLNRMVKSGPVWFSPPLFKLYLWMSVSKWDGVNFTIFSNNHS